MIDDDDVELFGWAFPVTGWISCIIFVIVVLSLSYLAFQNEQKCKANTCPPDQHAELLEGKCICVGKTIK